MRSIQTLSFSQLEEEMEALKEQDAQSCVGGGWFDYIHDLDEVTVYGSPIGGGGGLFPNDFSPGYEDYENYGGAGGGYTPGYDQDDIIPPQFQQPHPCKPSCVFNVFDYLDGSRHDACFYYEQTKANLGYEPLSNGGVRIRDIPTIGSYGGFNVQEMGSTAHLRSNGRSYYGNNQVIMSFYDSATRIDHLTVLTGVTNNADGTTTFYYYDPTNNVNGSTQQATGLYEVSNR